MVVFENVVAVTIMSVKLLIPDIPDTLKYRIRREVQDQERGTGLGERYRIRREVKGLERGTGSGEIKGSRKWHRITGMYRDRQDQERGTGSGELFWIRREVKGQERGKGSEER